MKVVVVYSKSNCIFCEKMKEDLNAMGVEYRLHEDDFNIIKTTNCKTFPQMFINGKFIGGYTEFKIMCSTLEFAKTIKSLTGNDVNIEF